MWFAKVGWELQQKHTCTRAAQACVASVFVAGGYHVLLVSKKTISNTKHTTCHPVYVSIVGLLFGAILHLIYLYCTGWQFVHIWREMHITWAMHVPMNTSHMLLCICLASTSCFTTFILLLVTK